MDSLYAANQVLGQCHTRVVRATPVRPVEATDASVRA